MMNYESAYDSNGSFAKKASGIGPQRQLHPCYLSSSRYVCPMDIRAITRTLAFIGTVQHPAVQHEKWRGELIALSHASMFIVHQPPDRMTVAVTLALSGLISSSATWGSRNGTAPHGHGKGERTYSKRCNDEQRRRWYLLR